MKEFVWLIVRCFPRAGEMTQWVKVLATQGRDLSLDHQNPREAVMVCICNPSIPTMRWEWETATSLQAGEPASLRYPEVSKRPVS